jgi:hypothetical protein
MLRNVRELPSFSAVAAGQTASMSLPVGNVKYAAVWLRYKTNANQATIEADIEEIRIKINGKVQRRYSAAQLNKMLALYGVGFAAGFIPIIFAEPWRRTPQGEDALGWGTADVATFQIEVDIASGALAPTLDAWADVVDVEETMGAIIKNRQYTIPVTATGVRNVQELPKTGTAYYALHLFETAAADISAVEIKTNQRDRFDAPAALNTAILATQDITVQSGVFSVVFDRTRRVGDSLSMVEGGRPVSDFQLDATMAVANNFTIITEEIGPRW